MGCPITLTGIAYECKDAVGGIKEVLIFEDYSNVASVDTSLGKVSAITLDSSLNKPKVFKFRKETGTFDTAATTSDEAGTTFYQTDVVLQFTKMETAKRLEIGALLIGNVSMIVKDGNGIYWYLGKDYPVTASAGTATSGKAMGDFNGYTITLVDKSVEFPFEVPQSVINTLV